MEVETPTKMMHAIKPTDSYRKDKRAVLGWMGTIFGGVALGAAGFAHGKLWSHETDIAVLKSEQSAVKEALREQSDLMRRVLQQLPRPIP